MIFADVVVGTQVPYVMAALFCFLVVPIEVGCFFGFQRGVVGFWASLGLIVLANAVSLIVGFIITRLIPVLEEFATHASRPEYFRGIVIGFVAAFFLSWLIEYWVIRLFQRRFVFHRLNRTVAVANLASYLAIFTAIMWRW
jgi:hypothetical protein